MSGFVRIGLGGIAAAALLASGFALASAAPGTGATTGAASPCRSLHVSLGRQGGAAGSVYQTLRFTNTGSASCTLSGAPAVAYTNIHRIMVGWPAGRPGSQVVRPAVVVPPGRTATAQLQLPNYQNFARIDCLPHSAHALRVTAVGTTHFLTWNTTECMTRWGRASIGSYSGPH